MNKDLEAIIKQYATKSHQTINNTLITKSQDNIISMLLDLITTYINDKNSSTLREYLTVSISGYEHSDKKIGYNGFKQSSYGKPLNCEAKPKNYDTYELEKYTQGQRKTRPSALNGGGNFADYTWHRFKKDKKKALNMLVSGFVDGKLIYIVEFPFGCHQFVNKLETQLKKRFPHGDRTSEYLRGASFSYVNFIGCKKLKINYLLNKKEIEKYKKYISGKFYNFLLKLCK